jgi:hypothetical protein
MLEVKCRCGAVGLDITGQPIAQVYCHCDDCQAAHGAAYALNAIYPAGAVQIAHGTPATSAVKTTPRLHCAACGTHLFTEVEAVAMRSLNAYLLPKGSFKPQFHIQCADAVLPVVDDLPHYKGFPAAFGGDDAVVVW